MKIWVFLDFEINHDRIVKELCVQRNNPNNTCQGNCYLSKQLQKSDDDKSRQLNRVLQFEFFPFVVNESDFCTPPKAETTSLFEWNQNHYLGFIPKTAGHPPELS